MNADTICAIATPGGVGGIAVIRISGPQAIEGVASVWRGADLRNAASHSAHLGLLVDESLPGGVLDQCVATVFRAPKSFTGEDTVELSLHGSIWIQQQALRLLTRNSTGIRLAEAGEFTRRAFANGRLDLARAEAVADVIAAGSQAAHALAMSQMRGHFSQRLTQLRERMLELAALLELELDFSEEDVNFASRDNLRALATELRDEVASLAASFNAGKAIRDGIPVAIVGETNAGKSSLMNALLGDERAIVSDIHGTTRDVVEDRLILGPYSFRLMDTAGLRDTTDTIENLGIERSLKAAEAAHILILVYDATKPVPDALRRLLNDPHRRHTILVANKTDLVADSHDNLQADVCLSALTGEGLDRLQSALVDSMDRDVASYHNSQIVTNRRHADALAATADALTRLLDGLATPDLPTDLLAEDLRDALHHLGTITGAIATPDILATVFSRFCIGK